MKKQTILDLYLDVWLLFYNLHHKMTLLRIKELHQHHITPRQIYVLRLIDALGTNARLSTLAKATERKFDVVSRQAVTMEKDGLIKRITDTPKSRLLRLELTEKGHELLKISRYSDGMIEISSTLTEQEIRQLDSVLNRLLVKINAYNPENKDKDYTIRRNLKNR